VLRCGGAGVQVLDRYSRDIELRRYDKGAVGEWEGAGGGCIAARRNMHTSAYRCCPLAFPYCV
jgi:hypothetical protein